MLKGFLIAVAMAGKTLVIVLTLSSYKNQQKSQTSLFNLTAKCMDMYIKGSFFPLLNLISVANKGRGGGDFDSNILTTS